MLGLGGLLGASGGYNLQDIPPELQAQIQAQML